MISRSRGGLFRWMDRRAVEKLLGIPLPDGAEDIHYVRRQPSTDLAYFEACIKFRASRDVYLDLVRRRGLKLFHETGPTAHLPRNWQQPDIIERLEWWDPGGETPPDAASATIGAYGWILAKWEHDHVYVLVSDTGHAAEMEQRTP